MLKNNKWIIHLFILVLLWGIHDLTTMDFKIQSWFYSSDSQTWFVDNKAFWPKLLFYNGLKWGIAIYGAFHVFTFLFIIYKYKKVSRSRLQIILSLALVPLVISYLKKYSGIYCPHELSLFGGEHSFATILQPSTGRCFPGGHASGGFALIALAFSWYKHPRLGLILGLGIGWIMGLYQMLKGDHFLTHTLVSQEISFIVNYLLAFFLRKKKIEA